MASVNGDAPEPNRACRTNPLLQTEASQHIDAERAETFTTHLVAREPVLLNEGDSAPPLRQHERRHAPARPGADDDHVRHQVDCMKHFRAGRYPIFWRAVWLPFVHLPKFQRL